MRAALTIVFVVGFAMGLRGQSRPETRRTVWDAVYTFEQSDRGRGLYQRHCAECHGPDLAGNPDVPDRHAPPGMSRGTPALLGPEFQSHWEELSLGNLWERIRLSMPQSRPGSLSRRENADITAYILESNGYPAGVTELSDNKTALDAILVGR